ncbi:ATP-binding protein [Pedobacter hiemivivus]|uniref:ATP-binding protein n=1 Tax=Pedobacter hiemivivus TaxID=2530454 RepID=A0A4U1G1Y5_9SPHI|nr:AAA family ATPase [Pedobacter hiemivivus]TKC57164.1 ATP-binding protein [Pedobacter hiemivivus]
MSFKRNIENYLNSWKLRDSRKPLIIRGARQVGKTTLIRDFAKAYQHRIILNLEKPGDRRYFEDFDDVQTILEALFLAHTIPSSAMANTLLFIDEIQESPKAIQLLRYFYEELPELHVISAGSLLEFAMQKVQSFPVGRVEFLYLHPLNFQEYLEAVGKQELLGYLQSVPIKPVAHKLLMDAFHRYAIIGGMPEIIKMDVQQQSLSDLPRIYESIWGTYKNDVEKYTSNDTERKIIKHLMDTAPLYLDERVKFQGFGNSSYRSREVGEAFRTLDDAKIIRLIYPTTDLQPPIKTDLKKSPRLQFLDTGLVNYSLGIQLEMLAMDDLNRAYKGAVIPHLVTQELISLQSISAHKPNFWVREKSQSNAEVDLLFTHQDLVIPIEIKSGSTGSLKSLHQFIDASDHPYAIRMYAGTFNIEKAITPSQKPYLLMNLPYYAGTSLPQYVEWFVRQEV